MSADGRIAVGNAHEKERPECTRAFLWTEDQGTTLLESHDQGSSTYAYGISTDGRTVVGYVFDDIANAYRAVAWSKGEGIKFLGSPVAKYHSYATAVNHDGRVIVGYAKDGYYSALKEAFIWTQKTGMVSIGSQDLGMAGELMKLM